MEVSSISMTNSMISEMQKKVSRNIGYKQQKETRHSEARLNFKNVQ